MLTVDDVVRMSRRELSAVLCHGYPIDPAALDDTEYDGVSLGLPEWVERLTWKRFMKVFHRDGAHLRGWNVRIEDGPLTEPWVKQTRGGQPRTFGHFRVVPAAGHPMPKPCDQALLIHYGLGGNLPWDATARMRDPLVAVNPGSVELLLGWSYLDLGRARVPTPSYFSLRRAGPLSHTVEPPLAAVQRRARKAARILRLPGSR